MVLRVTASNFVPSALTNRKRSATFGIFAQRPHMLNAGQVYTASVTRTVKNDHTDTLKLIRSRRRKAGSHTKSK